MVLAPLPDVRSGRRLPERRIIKIEFFMSQQWQGPLLIGIAICVVLAIAFMADR